MNLAHFHTRAEDDESSARTSAAADDGDDVGRMEDTVFHADYFNFGAEEQQQQPVAPVGDHSAASVEISAPYLNGVTSPPRTTENCYDSLAGLEKGHDLPSVMGGGSGSGSGGSSRLSPSSHELGQGGILGEDAFGVGRGIGNGNGDGAPGQPVLIPPPPREEQFAMVKKMMKEIESKKMMVGETRYLVSRE